MSGTFQAYHIRGTVTVGGTTASTISNVITVAAALAFGGTLNVTNLGGTLVEGQSFDLFDFDFALSSGIFSAVNLPSLDSGLEWNDSALYTTGVISVIPEPGTPALLASLAGVLARGGWSAVAGASPSSWSVSLQYVHGASRPMKFGIASIPGARRPRNGLARTASHVVSARQRSATS